MGVAFYLPNKLGKAATCAFLAMTPSNSSQEQTAESLPHAGCGLISLDHISSSKEGRIRTWANRHGGFINKLMAAVIVSVSEQKSLETGQKSYQVATNIIQISCYGLVHFTCFYWFSHCCIDLKNKKHPKALSSWEGRSLYSLETSPLLIIKLNSK